MDKKQLRKQLKANIAKMPKCPVCGGFAIPSATVSGSFFCKYHGRFTPNGEER